LSKILLETHKADFGSLKPTDKDRHSKRLIDVCVAARRLELSPASADLVDLVGEILRRGKRDMAKLINEAERLQAQKLHTAASQNRKYPPEFADALRLDGEPALFSYNEFGALTRVQLLEPFWARFYVDRNDVVFIQETAQFKLYDRSLGLWEYLAPSILEDELSILIRQYAAKVPILADLDNQRSRRTLENIRSQVKNKITTPDPFRKKRQFIHLKNTMLVWNKDSNCFQQEPFSKDFFSTGRIEVDYVPKATCPQFDAFLQASLSDDDIDLVQCWFGLVVLGANPAKKILLNVGLRDRGKTQLVLIAKHLAGDGKFSLLRSRHLENRFELGIMRDSTLLYGSDVDRKFLMHEGIDMLKSLVGGDPLSGEVKYGLLPTEIRGQFNVCISTNEKLRIRIGHDPESWRNRLWIINFYDRAPFTPVPDFAEKLWQDEAQGIVAWAIQGATLVLSLLAANGKIQLSKDQQARVDKLIAESVSVWEFVRTCLLQNPEKDITTDELFDNYSAWCDTQQIMPLLKSSFLQESRSALEELLHAKLRHDIERLVSVKSPDGSTCLKPTQKRGYAQIGLSPTWASSQFTH
jgi:phage/plasmid-associated DNA primase